MRSVSENTAVVVGVDGSASSQDALDWAVSEASTTQRPLRIVHADEADHAGGATPTTVLAEATMRAHSLAPELEIISTEVAAAATPALLRHTDGAELLVVGSRGPGHQAARRSGSIGQTMVARAPCPVVVVPPGRARNTAAAGRIVVLSDASRQSRTATRFAFEVAARRRIGLTVVRTWTPPFAGYPRMVLGLPRLAREQRRALLEDLSVDRQRFPEVELALKLVRDKDNHHGRALVTESATATLVVLEWHGHGHRHGHGHGSFPGLHSDAVCQSVLELAHCPVAVVKTRPNTAPSDDGAVHFIRSGASTRGPKRGPWSEEVSAVQRWLSTT